MIIIVFGLAASGKTYIGNILGKHFNFHHEDADQWLSYDMQQYIGEEKLFTLAMLDTFTQNIIKNIEISQKKHSNIVISQALYRQENRECIKRYFSSQEIIFLQVAASDKVIQQRLLKRGTKISLEYAASMHKYFEVMEEAIIINNDQADAEEIIKQLLTIKGIKLKHE